MSAELLNYLSGFVTKQRLDKFDYVLENRTRYISLVCEDIYQSHNASALMRTCDCFGIQDIHIIETKNSFAINKDVALGASNWLSIFKYSNLQHKTSPVFQELRSKGYRIVATTPHKDGISLNELKLEKGPVSLIFGTEMEGLSSAAREEADEFLTIDMYGFTESFNVSVSAGIILHYLRMKLMDSDIDWKLTKKEKFLLKLDWLRKSVKSSNLIEKEFRKNQKSSFGNED
ncbi:MAG: RNA methyltransferase [Bacteroidales bacterium]